MKQHKKIFLMSFSLIMVYLLGCKNERDLDLWAGFYCKDSTLIVRMNNSTNDKIFFASDPWLSYVGDTLYLDATFKNRGPDFFEIAYNQFNPPPFHSLEPGTLFIRKLRCKYILNVVVIRFFYQQFPFHKDKDYVKYHSKSEFLEFEKFNSTVRFITLQKIDSLENW